MSQPMRYRCDHCVTQDGTVPMLADQEGHMAPEGEYILQADYARLKAEVEAYKPASDEVAAAFLALPAPHNQVGRVIEGIESLKAEVQRLRQAGDWMFNAIILNSDKDMGQAMDAWTAAKEGKPSV